MTRDQVYTTNALLCPVSEDKPLRAKDLAACNERLHIELRSLTNPKVILCLGASAATAVTGEKRSMGMMSGRTEWNADYQAYIAFAYHPAAVLRNPGLYTDFRGALRRALRHREAEPGPIPVPEVAYTAYTGPAHVRDALATLARLATCPVIACDLETTGLDPLTGRILDIGFAATGDHAYIFNEGVLADASVQAATRWLLASENVKWLWHNGKFDVKMLRAHGYPARVDGDTMLLHYCLDERTGGEGGGFHGLKRLSHAYCGAPLYAQDVDTAHMESVPLDVRHPYHAADCVYTFQLWEALTDQAAREPASREGYPMPREVHDRLLVPASNAFADIELRGLRVDRARLTTLQLSTLEQIEATRTRVEGLVPEHLRPVVKKPKDRFNPNSTKQVLSVLNTFEEYAPITSTDKTTMHSLQRKDMEANRPPNPFLEQVMAYRSLLHTKTTYLDGIEARLSADGRLRGTFLLHGTTSGRLSSRDPNLQNLPKDSALKDVFIPSDGRVMCEADYRRLEVGVLAFYSADERLAADFAAPDFHWNVAQSVFPSIVAEMEASRGWLAPLEDICNDHAMFADFARRQARPNERTNDPDVLYGWLKTRLRRQAKYVTFGIMYGEGAKSLADVEKGLGVEVSEAASFIRQWKRTYPTAVRFLEKQVTLAERTRWVESMSGRRRRFNYPLDLQTHISNEAMNHPIQALASDICLLALLKLNEELPARGLGDVLLSVHDSILFELDAVRLKEATDLVHSVMTTILKSDLVTFEIDLAVGPTWGSCH